MRIKIFTEGGKDIGLGHISRCSSLYNEIANRGISVDFIVHGNIGDIEFLKGINIINENWLCKEYLLNNVSSDDYVIVDSYIATKETYEIISKKSKKALFIDDVGRIAYPEGIIVNPSLDSSHIDYSHSLNSILLSGPDYVIVRPPFVGIKRETTFNCLKRILIIMGGTDIRGLTPLLINYVCKNLKDVEFDVVIGSKEIHEVYDQYLGFKNVAIHYNIDATKMVELMMSCDLAITAAGQTIYELLATQTLFIPIQIIKNQENNIRSLLKYNPNQIILKYDNSNLVEDILNALDTYDVSGYKQEQNKPYEGLIDGYGAERIIDKLLEE